jgi:hypothetical protein
MNAFEETLEHIRDSNHYREDEILAVEVSNFAEFYCASRGDDRAILSLRAPIKWADLQPMEYWDYYSGYGGQTLFGTIWYTDGTWSTRGEYDGSEWWDHKTRPDVPKQGAVPCKDCNDTCYPPETKCDDCKKG